MSEENVVRLKDQELAGIVEPGSENQQLLDDVATEVEGQRNPANGSVSAHALPRSDDVSHGPGRHQRGVDSPAHYQGRAWRQISGERSL